MFSAAGNGTENGQDAPFVRTCGWPGLALLATGKTVVSPGRISRPVGRQTDMAVRDPVVFAEV
jgi:hypothetical protein